MTAILQKTNSLGEAVSSFSKATISFQRGFVVPTQEKSTLTLQQKYSVQAELMQLGYVLTPEALEHVTLSWFKDIMSFLKKALGLGSYRPFYVNFPQQVMETSYCELYMNAVIHYMSNGTWEPAQVLKDRGFEFENVEFTIIKLGDEAEFAAIFTRLVSINQSITENDKNIISWFVGTYKDQGLGLIMPERIPFKETLCMLAGLNLPVPVGTPTDVLRIAVYLSGGDISLPAIPQVKTEAPYLNTKNFRSSAASRLIHQRETERVAREKFKFAKFSRPQRKYLLSLLESLSFIDLADMKNRAERWVRLGEILHVGEYAKQFPNAAAAFNVLRNDLKSVKTYEGKVDAAFKISFEEGIKEVAKKPSMFARKLDWLLRTYNKTFVMREFKLVASQVSRKVLWELYNHFLKRDSSNTRSIMIKGKKAIRKQLPALEPMDKISVIKTQNVILNCIGDQFSKLEKMGKVWIDPKLTKIPLPTAMRSVNTSVKTYMRGTRIPFSKDAKTVRSYIHWTDPRGDQDLDLSVGFYNESLQPIGHISFTNLKEPRFGAYHSGDIRHRRGPCAEYVDLDIATALSTGMRYAMVQVYNYNGWPMHTMKDCVFGVMEREFPKANEIFLPKTISNAMGIANESTTVFICMLDLKEREYIWLDLESSGSFPTLESNSGTAAQIIKVAISAQFLSVHDLLTLHAENRGEIVADESTADVKFTFEDFVGGYDKVASFM